MAQGTVHKRGQGQWWGGRVEGVEKGSLTAA